MTRPPLGLFLLLLALAPPGCRPEPRGPAREAPDPGGARGDHPAREAKAEGESEDEKSDLDRPIEELFAATCEHGRKTHECDECRYEVGVVRAPAHLFDGGLLKVTTVGRRAVEATMELTGEVRFDERRVTHLGTRSEGIVRKVYTALGEKVVKGQPLVEIESLGVGQAEGEYLEARSGRDLARRAFERQETLRREQISSEKEYLQARQEYESADLRARAAGEKLIRLGLSPAELAALGRGGRVGRGRFVLRAPAAGTVLVMHAVAGELARAEAGLFVLGDPSTLWLWADLYENDLADVAEHTARGDLRATVRVKAFPREEFAGRVDFVGPTMDEATRTVKVRLEVANPLGKLRAGMFASVRLALPGSEPVVAVPRAAVLADAGRSFVFVRHHGDYFVRRPVTTGRAWGGWIEITRGLAGGESVVTEGGFLLKSDVLRSKMGAGCAD